jgi:hypothetical protein
MRRYCYTIIAVSLLVTVSVSKPRASDWFTVDGYYKNFSVAYDFPGCQAPVTPPDQPVLGSVSNRIRLNGRLRLTDWLAFSTAYNFAPRIQDPSLFHEQVFLVGIDPGSYRAADLDERLYPAPDDSVASFAVLQNLDRAFFTVTAPKFDLYVGRQAIAWGSGHVINPTDVIAPYTYDELDTEDRIGVDAVRVRVPIGFMAEIDAGYVFGDDFEFAQSAFFTRGKFYAVRTDWSVLLVGFRENLLVGLDLTRNIGRAGFWMEGAYVFIDALDRDHINQGSDYFRGSIGFDYSFWGDTYGFMEYHFNGAGSNRAESYFDNLFTTAYTEGSIYLMGKHYLAPGVSHQLTPLITAAGEALVNLSDPSVFLAPNLEYNIAQDIYIAAGANVGIGRRPEVITATGPGSNWVTFRSEFGSYPDTYYTSFRIYF